MRRRQVSVCAGVRVRLECLRLSTSPKSAEVECGTPASRKSPKHHARIASAHTVRGGGFSACRLDGCLCHRPCPVQPQHSWSAIVQGPATWRPQDVAVHCARPAHRSPRAAAPHAPVGADPWCWVGWRAGWSAVRAPSRAAARRRGCHQDSWPSSSLPEVKLP